MTALICVLLFLMLLPMVLLVGTWAALRHKRRRDEAAAQNTDP
jgi:cbb3-type cytochrome oxidase subunit 3